ncbi:MAG: DNA methylase [Clostridiales bacterium]|nr:DNA methylase [Clostridiales bacterium]
MANNLPSSGNPGTFLAIDLKSFYSSVECVDRHLDPLTTNLVVADPERTDKTICLAVSPSLKALGISGRARLFEARQQVARANASRLAKAPGRVFSSSSFDAEALAADPALELSFITAPPRMTRYVEVSAQIYTAYLRFISADDIFRYSIDEVFIDIAPYLNTYRLSAHDMAMMLVREVLYTTGITATCGIGTNLYLAKIAMDIVAKHAPADKDGVRIAELNESSYRALLWDHRPLTDFWRIGHGTAKRLEQRQIFTMGDLARTSVYDQEWFFRTFGIDAEILIDHAWGEEPVTMRHIKSYQPSDHCICEGQVLMEPYPCEKARIIVREMSDSLMLQLAGKGLSTDLLTLDIGYDRENVDSGNYKGRIRIDRYGRAVPYLAHGSARLDNPTNIGSLLQEALLNIYDRIADPSLLVRRISIAADHVVQDTEMIQMDLFTDTEQLEKEKKLQEALLSIKNKYGKNAILKGTSYREGATMRERNGQIGGHKA